MRRLSVSFINAFGAIDAGGTSSFRDLVKRNFDQVLLRIDGRSGGPRLTRQIFCADGSLR
jgi:hypothetical protein